MKMSDRTPIEHLEHWRFEKREAERDAAEARAEQPEEYKGWPGDGSGMDDFADYNQNEADDYRNE